MIWVVAIALILAAPFIQERGRALPNSREAPGTLIKLPSGLTHFRWFGPARGPVIVAIHGLTTPSPAWDAMAKTLGKIGYRVLTYDLYGRGFSGNSLSKQSREFHVRQLTELLDHLALREDLTLMGYSMGGMIATAFASENPDRMKRLILIASGGVEVNHEPAAKFMIKVPILGDWLHHGYGMWRFRRSLLASRAEPTEVPGIADIQIAQLDRRGFRGAVLSSLRGTLNEQQEADHRALGRASVPVIAIWGDQDSVIPIRALGTLSQWNRLARQEVVKGAGHGLPYTHGTETAGLLREVLREKD